MPLSFSVPYLKQVRVIVHTDCKNEADDQFALAHHLMTPMFDVRGIVAGHFELGNARYGKGNTNKASYEEIGRVLELMELEGQYPVVLGAPWPMEDEATPIDSEGARLIIREAMRDDERPLYVALQGAITDLACALLLEPRIAGRLTAIWIGGGAWPDGGEEFNLMNDIHAANAVFRSEAALWQVPRDVYKQVNVTLAELEYRVAPCGALGAYLSRQMVELNDRMGEVLRWPHGESWCLGDQPTVSLLLEDKQRRNYTLRPAPRVAPDMRYLHDQGYRPIRVYHTVDVRLTMEDFYAKLALNYGERRRPD